MKILIISDAWVPQLSGVVRTYQNLIPELEKLGHEVKILGPSDFPIRTPALFDVEMALFSHKKIKETIDVFNPDRIHIAVEGPLGWAARKICLKQNLPFSTCFHTHFPDFVTSHLQGPFKKFEKQLHTLTFNILRDFHSASHTIFTATQELTNQLKEQGFTGPFLPMTRGADARYFHIGQKNLFQNMQSPVALYVGRVSKEKNITAFLDAPWHGSKIIVGDGPDLNRLKQTYPAACFLGRKEGKELGDCFRSADIFVFPSKFDTFGIVMIEALVCGLPVASFNANGANSIITDPILGAKHDNLSTAMKHALSSPATRQQRADMAISRYSWGKTAKQFLAFSPDYG